ncbi:type II toxin-antitoxin system RelE/ParE family toxin [Caulobacter endophyticus]|uniref:Toxin n=1 Tax=Caulobacter endophyticus TaxID=2172652 RepID=A0A2T9KDA4_9CAUL|nr:type II toxin-antitoxin system RelE/ParE family toxin [Caulobacter endophyticus]PVM93958.1 plasmid stabilization protein ParE [Caulobacter endophyticus]
MSRLAFRPLARKDLRDIWNYSHDRWGAKRADDYASGLNKLLKRLAAGPSLGEACGHVRDGYRRHPSGSHMIYYRLADRGIEVVRILHQQMDPGSRL